jgi:hypothetical protein
LDAFSEANIDCIKLPPSTTSEHQANDVASTFKDMKKGIETVTKNPLKKVANPTLNAAILKAFDELKAEYPSLDIKSDYKSKICGGFVTLVHLMKSGYVTAEKNMLGFIACGQHIADAVAGDDPTVDYDKIMERCYQEVTEEQQVILRANREAVGKEFARTGMVSKVFLDRLGIVQDPVGAPNRDILILARQDCFIITHFDTIQRYLEYLRKKTEAKDPVAKEHNKMLSQAEKLLYNEEKKKKTKEENERKKKEEKERRAMLSPEEKAAEDAQKKAAAAAKRKEAAEAAKQKLKEALDIVGAERAAQIQDEVRNGGVVNSTEDHVDEEGYEETAVI